MKYSVSLEDSNTQCIVVKVPMKFRRIGGRKTIILPDHIADQTRCTTDDPLIIAIARAHRWQELLDSGKIRSIADFAVKLNMDPSQVGRIFDSPCWHPILLKLLYREPYPPIYPSVNSPPNYLSYGMNNVSCY